MEELFGRRIKREIRGFFKSLYYQKDLLNIKIQDGLVNKISLQQARCLETIYEGDEIKTTVWACDLLKAPRPDGYNLNFVRKMWNVVVNLFLDWSSQAEPELDLGHFDSKI